MQNHKNTVSELTLYCVWWKNIDAFQLVLRISTSWYTIFVADINTSVKNGTSWYSLLSMILYLILHNITHTIINKSAQYVKQSKINIINTYLLNSNCATNHPNTLPTTTIHKPLPNSNYTTNRCPILTIPQTAAHYNHSQTAAQF